MTGHLANDVPYTPLGAVTTDNVIPLRSGASEYNPHLTNSRPARAHLLCIGGEDHNLRIPFLLALRDRGFRVTAAGTGDPAPFALTGLEYRPFRFDRFVNPLADGSAIRTLTALIGDVNPDIVQSFDTKPNLLVPIAARNLPRVRVARTINGLGQIYSSRSLTALALQRIFPLLQRAASRSTALTIFQNREDKIFFERHRMIGKGTSRLIQGSGVDIDGFDQARSSGASANELRQQLDLCDAELVITVARLTRQKGIQTLLEAASLLQKVRPKVRFLLVGPRESEGPSAITQAELDRHAPYVLSLGKRSDIPNLLGLADVFAFPTEYREGVPRVLLEAALANLPIVTTNMPGCSDVVQDGWSGYLVPPRDPQALAARIQDVLNQRQLAREMGLRAGQLVRRDFGLQITVDRYTEAYESLLDQSGADPTSSPRNSTASTPSLQEAHL